MTVHLHPHALIRLQERGTTQEEVERTVLEGEKFPAKYGRTGFRRNFSFDGQWLGKNYSFKQVEALAVWENDSWLVITVITRFF